MNLLHQPKEKRYAVHVTYGTPHKRGRVQVIEDLVPLYDTPVSVAFEEKITKAYLIPGKEKLVLNKIDGRIQVEIPKFRCHKAVVFECE